MQDSILNIDVQLSISFGVSEGRRSVDTTMISLPELSRPMSMQQLHPIFGDLTTPRVLVLNTFLNLEGMTPHILR